MGIVHKKNTHFHKPASIVCYICISSHIVMPSKRLYSSLIIINFIRFKTYMYQLKGLNPCTNMGGKILENRRCFKNV